VGSTRSSRQRIEEARPPPILSAGYPEDAYFRQDPLFLAPLCAEGCDCTAWELPTAVAVGWGLRSAPRSAAEFSQYK